jgi:hypothetical protein
VSSPVEDEAQKADKLHKVREIWDDFISRCKILFWLAQQLGLDEAIKKFKGRCSFKQYIKSKPVRWGLKIFCVCCSLTGYLWNATICVGKNETETETEKKKISAGHTVWLSVCCSLYLAKTTLSTWTIGLHQFLFSTLLLP